jgi:hypothetical protein
MFFGLNEVYLEVVSRYRYIQQARKVRMLEELQGRIFKGERISYHRMLAESVELLHSLKFEIVSYFDTLVETAIDICESILNDRYLVRTYIEKQEEILTPAGLEVKKNYGRLIALIDELRAIRKSRKETLPAA